MKRDYKDNPAIASIVDNIAPRDFLEMPIATIADFERNAVRRRPVKKPTQLRERTIIEATIAVLLWQNAKFCIAPYPYGERGMHLSRGVASALCSLAFNELYGLRIYAAPTASYKTLLHSGFCVLDEDEDGMFDYRLTTLGATAWQQFTLYYLDFILVELNQLMEMIWGTAHE